MCCGHIFRAYLEDAVCSGVRGDSYSELLSSPVPFSSHHSLWEKGTRVGFLETKCLGSAPPFPSPPPAGVLGFRTKHLPQSFSCKSGSNFLLPSRRGSVRKASLWNYQILQWLVGSQKAPPKDWVLGWRLDGPCREIKNPEGGGKRKEEEGHQCPFSPSLPSSLQTRACSYSVFHEDPWSPREAVPCVCLLSWFLLLPQLSCENR